MTSNSLNLEVGENYKPMSYDELVAFAKDNANLPDFNGKFYKRYSDEFKNEVVSYYYQKIPSHNYWTIHRALMICEGMSFDTAVLVLDDVKEQFEYKFTESSKAEKQEFAPRAQASTVDIDKLSEAEKITIEFEEL